MLNYSALAAAGLLVEPATAGVVYSGPSFTAVTVVAGETKPIDFGAPFGQVFQFVGATTFYTPPSASFVIQPGPAGLAAAVVSPTLDNPARLGSGYFIDGARTFRAISNGTGADFAGASNGFWNGAGVIRGYAGFRFVSSGSNYYGYFDVSYDNNPSSDNGTLTIHGWAYEDVAGTGITTGPTDIGGAVPEPATLATLGLGLLAMGAAGIRKKRAQAQKAA